MSVLDADANEENDEEENQEVEVENLAAWLLRLRSAGRAALGEDREQAKQAEPRAKPLSTKCFFSSSSSATDSFSSMERLRSRVGTDDDDVAEVFSPLRSPQQRESSECAKEEKDDEKTSVIIISLLSTRTLQILQWMEMRRSNSGGSHTDLRKRHWSFDSWPWLKPLLFCLVPAKHQSSGDHIGGCKDLDLRHCPCLSMLSFHL